MVCKQLAEDERLAKGFNAIGFSQGSQFLYAGPCSSLSSLPVSPWPCILGRPAKLSFPLSTVGFRTTAEHLACPAPDPPPPPRRAPPILPLSPQARICGEVQHAQGPQPHFPGRPAPRCVIRLWAATGRRGEEGGGDQLPGVLFFLSVTACAK